MKTKTIMLGLIVVFAAVGAVAALRAADNAAQPAKPDRKIGENTIIWDDLRVADLWEGGEYVCLGAYFEECKGRSGKYYVPCGTRVIIEEIEKDEKPRKGSKLPSIEITMKFATEDGKTKYVKWDIEEASGAMKAPFIRVLETQGEPILAKQHR